MEPSKPYALSASEGAMPEPETFELIYEGPEVRQGTMEASRLAEVLTGLSRAFSAVAHEEEFGGAYQLRVKGIQSNSFHLILEAIAFAKSNPAAATAIAASAAVAVNAVQATVSGAYKFVSDVAKLIDAKIRTKGAQIATLPTSSDNGQKTIAFEDQSISLTKQQYELLLNKQVDRGLSQIVSPLEANKIDSFEIRRPNAGLIRVGAEQKHYFDYVPLKTRDVKEESFEKIGTLQGTINSLSKTKLSGTFFTVDGIHVKYRYIGDDIGQLLDGFSAREPLKVSGKVKYASTGIPTYVEVREIELSQRSLLGK